MDKLKKANLYRNELFSVSGKLVERYNRCLVKMGFEKTNLKAFSIDGLGWSPEIAEEKNAPFYLNNGEANTHAIIITPKQKGIPVYNAFHSFDEELMKTVFKNHSEVIKDITRDSAICLDFDQGVDVFYEPLDVLKYATITIKFHLIDDLKQAKKEQLKLIEVFNQENNFIDEKIHSKILDSAKKYGDLRLRKVVLDSLKFTTDSFFTKAFGGVFILRDFVKPILIFESKNSFEEAKKDTTFNGLIYHISDVELIEKLKSHSILEVNLEQELQSKRYERIKKYTFSKLIKESNHPIKQILDDTILFKSYLNKIDIVSRKKLMGAEIYLEKRKVSKSIKPQDYINEELFVSLHKPHSSLKAAHQDLIWKLLVSIAPIDILFLYWYNREEFYKIFYALDDSMQDWVIEAICNNF